jgi:hypothetical protein
MVHLAVPLFRVFRTVLWNMAPCGLVQMYQRLDEFVAFIFSVVKVILNCNENGDSKMLRNLVTYVRLLTASYPRRLTFYQHCRENFEYRFTFHGFYSNTCIQLDIGTVEQNMW